MARLFYEFYPAKAGGRRVISDDSAMIPIGDRSYIVATYGEGKRRLYVNARKVDECAIESVLRPIDVPLTVGARGDNSEWFSGRVEHVALYSRVLQEGEISQHARLFRRCHWPADDLPRLFAWRAACQSLLCTQEFIYLE
jgi:hypothetical protein